jgi:hypothetical protein
VAELADARDSKSRGPKDRGGSSPSSSTIFWQALFHFPRLIGSGRNSLPKTIGSAQRENSWLKIEDQPGIHLKVALVQTKKLCAEPIAFRPEGSMRTENEVHAASRQSTER